jgi:EAL domain-containing protein (putative c-di-GMP-specific phosphodiesterase class I)
LQDNAGTLKTLESLSDLGVGIALDDFGTGYASLSYLNRFPFDKIKIDQSFIRAMPNGGDSATIVRAITDLVHTLGMRIVAEGVETTRELSEVRRAGCDEVQGYYFSGPVPVARLQDIIAACNGRIQDRAA